VPDEDRPGDIYASKVIVSVAPEEGASLMETLQAEAPLKARG